MNTPTYAITGHRDLRLEDIPSIKEKLKDNLQKLGVKSILTGNAEGVDQITQEIAGELGIKIILLSAVVPDLEESNTYYAQQADHIVKNCTHIIAVWDGLYTGKPGGTSDIVHRALKSKRPVNLFQLVCPRESNPYPVANLLDKVIDFENKQFTRIPFALPFSWLSLRVEPKKELKKKQSFWRDKFFQLLAIVFFVLITLTLGTWGFEARDDADGWSNSFFESLGLISLSTSETGLKPDEILLHIARITGFLALAVTLFFGAYDLLLPKLKAARRNYWKTRKNFILVVGLTRKSFDLIVDLSLNKKKRVVVLDPDEQNPFKVDLENLKKVHILKGNLCSRTSLTAAGAPEARQIFIMSNSDSENIRTAQELDVMDKPNGKQSSVDWFVHLEDEEKRRFLHNSLSEDGQNRTNLFNVYENTVRRLFLYYPPDRFYLNSEAQHLHPVILGFDKLGRQLTLTLLKQGHYSRDKYLNITVYCKDASTEEEKFLRENPQFRPDVFENENPHSDIYQYTWSNIELKFKEIPVSDTEWLSDQNTIFEALRSGRILNLYACLEDGIRSATYLSTLLPKIDALKAEMLKKEQKADVQVFCYYNFPDKKEEEIIEEYFNKIAPYTFVKCFGNYAEECSASAIQGMSLDALPMMINAGYHNKEYEKAESHWRGLSEKDKVSNRQAADHLWSKIRLVWHRIQWQFDPVTFEPATDVLKDTDLLEQYGEIEHRRWCADLLLQGFSPFDEKYDSPEYKKTAHRWDNEAGFKASHQIQKRHISLVPYDHLTDENKKKDIDQIKEIPVFLRKVVNTRPPVRLTFFPRLIQFLRKLFH